MIDIKSLETYFNQESEHNLHQIMNHIKKASESELGFISAKLRTNDGLTDRLIQHFEDLEQYENCQQLMRLKSK